MPLLAALFISPLAALHAADAPKQKFNILHIHADDHRADGLHSLGNPLLQTPSLDSLVERGTTFTHCYTMGSMTGAVCTPSRTMMLTGRSWLADHPENKAKIEGMTALLQKEMSDHADTFPLTVANPEPAKWSPPASGGERKKKPGKNKP